jgi:thioesterase domain-containing protein
MEVAGLVAPGTPPHEVSGMLAVFEANIQAGMSYRPKPAPVRLVLLRATHGIGQDRSDPFLGWEALAAEAEVQVVPGNHLTMIREPNVRELAEQLRGCLERAHQASMG